MGSVGTEIQLPISCRRQAAVLTMLVDSQLPLAATHSFCIVNKQFKGKCQPREGRSSSGYNISSIPPCPCSSPVARQVTDVVSNEDGTHNLLCWC